MAKKLIALHPGYVESKVDGDRHFISAPQLAGLYNVSLNKCVVWDYKRPETFLGRDAKDYYHASPLYSGNYPDWRHLQQEEQ